MTGAAAAIREQARQVRAVAWADLLERLRRYSYLVTLAGTLYFGWLVNAGYVRLTVRGVRGVYNSAWMGTLIALSVGCLLSLVGFYLVKNALDHDRRSGVGEVLAATPLPRLAYVLGKTVSNFLLLGSIVVLLEVAAAVSQLLAAEDTHLDVLALLTPVALLTVPILALTAAAAVLFEVVRWLRGTLGNVLFFILWSFALSMTARPLGGDADLIGGHAVERSFIHSLPAGLATREGMSFTIGPPGEDGGSAAAAGGLPGGFPAPPRPSGVRWEGLSWTPVLVAQRLAWTGCALALVLLAALLFDRFDPARQARRRPRRKGRAAERDAPGVGPADGSPDAGLAADGARAAGAAELRYRRPRGGTWAPRSRTLHLVLAELRLMLRGRSAWWFVGAAGLCLGGLVAPAGKARAALLAVAWIWPLPLWSELGAREALHGTRPLLLAAPLAPAPRAAAAWAAGTGVAALAGAGVALRLALAGDAHGLLAWIAGCLFIPALALALGAVSGSPRLFEVVYLLVWYIGPMNGVALFDFTGLGPASRAAAHACAYLALAAFLFTAAAAVAARQTDR